MNIHDYQAKEILRKYGVAVLSGQAAMDPAAGFADFQGRKLAYGLGLPKDSIPKAVSFMRALYRAFIESDASLVEINPLVLTKAGDLIALDAKMGFDDNALFRHPDVRAMRDVTEAH